MAEPRLITAAEAALDDVGDVKGPGPVTDGNIALFDGPTGTLLKAAGVVEGVATIDSTTNLLAGDDAGNAVDSGKAVADLLSIPITLNPGDVLAQDEGDNPLINRDADGLVNAKASLILYSSGAVLDSGNLPFTSDNARIGIVDANDVEILSIFSGGTFNDNDGSLYIGDSLPEGFAGVAGDPGTPGSQDNVAVGFSSMESSEIDAAANTALGVASLKSLTTGSDNTVVGVAAGQSLVDGAGNVIIGRTADITEPSGSNITLIGSQVDSDVGVTDNATAIGSGSVVKIDNTVVVGNVNVTDVYFGFPEANQNVGVLVVGSHYLIVDFHAGDDFTNVGAGSNSSGEIFIATGTTPTVWDHTSNLALLTGAAILHGKGDAVVFPDSDPHIAGAAYWVDGVLTKSAG